jgi:hypothetical protein
MKRKLHAEGPCDVNYRGRDVKEGNDADGREI